MDTVLPPLRQELSLYPGPAKRNGSKTWVLSDPPANRFFHISWSSLEILSRWGLGNSDAIVESVNNETTLHITPEHVQSMIGFVLNNHLVEVRNDTNYGLLLASFRKQRQHWAKWLLKNYLFLRVPLVKPEQILDFFAPWVGWAFSVWFWRLVIIAAVMGGYLVFRQWDSFISTFSAFSSWHQLACFTAALVVCKVIHELGHAFAAQRYGCRIGSMGVAFLVLFPMLFTDTNEAWKLPSRKQRMIIGGAGMLAELSLAIFALLVWSFLPGGLLQSIVFFLATTSWIMSLFMNLSPFMRFDGYFLLSDFTGIQNMHERAFAFGRWRIRKFMMGIHTPPPEILNQRAMNWLTVFGFATWLYRFFLFLSISLVVYFFFFKVLGIFLMAVEISWFICLPVIKEIQQWWMQRHMFRFNKYNIVFFCIICITFALFLIPWSGTVSAPSFWRATEHREIYAPFPARVAEIVVTLGQHVKQGDLLMRLEDPDLEYFIKQANSQKELLQWQMERQSLNDRLLEQGDVIEQRLAEAVSRLREGLDRAEKLLITAPISGVIAEMNETISKGTWVADQEPLFFLTTDSGSVIETFIKEADLRRIDPDAGSVFYSEIPEWEPIECKSIEIDSVNIPEFEEPYLVSIYGGDLAARITPDRRIVPEYPLYRVRQKNCLTQKHPKRIVRGRTTFEGKPESILLKFYRRVSAILIRESGF